MRRRLVFVCLPLLLVASQGAHALVGLFASEKYEGAELFERGGVGRELMPYLTSAAVAVVVGALAVELLSRTGERRSHRPPHLLFALLPVLLFAVQEHVEHWAGHGNVDWLLALQPAFVAGVLLQLPFAALAYVVGRSLLDLASAIRLRREGAPGSAPSTLVHLRQSQILEPLALHAMCRCTRGPPLLSCR
jgi:hypothetical protein